MRSFPLIRSTLQGVFGAGTGFSDEEALLALERDLRHPAFREGIALELRNAAAEPTFSWRELLAECDVAYVESEHEAAELAKLLFEQVSV